MTGTSIRGLVHADHWLEAKPQSPRFLGTSMRVCSLDETESDALALLDECGITRIADVTDLDRVGIDVYHSVRPRAMPGLNTVTSGKGVTKQVARVSAMMEAIERRWCEPPDDGLTVQSYAQLSAAGFSALDPIRLIPRRTHRWTPDTPISWFPMRELVSSRAVLVPALAVFTPFAHESELFSSNTIGLAIGNSPKEALLHALLEVIEHDTTAFGETLRLGHRIDPTTLSNEAARLLGMFSAARVGVDILSYSTEIGVPTFHVVTEDLYRRDGMLFSGGVGCHLNPEVALLRALTEAAQSRLNVIAGAREDFDRQAYRRHTSYADVKARFDAWLSGRRTIRFTDLEGIGSGTLDGDLEVVVSRLGAAGVSTICAAELAPPGFRFSVTKVCVPGLEVFHEDRLRMGPRLHRRLPTPVPQKVTS